MGKTFPRAGLFFRAAPRAGKARQWFKSTMSSTGKDSASASASSAASPAATLDMREQFMATLGATMGRLRDMYPGCERTRRHVTELLAHMDEARTRERSIKMWHRSMEPHYVAISQTRDAERCEAALLAGMRANWFLSGAGMADKWLDESFAPSRERFLQTVRVLNGLAFLQHSFLGKLAGALSQVTERLAASSAAAAAAADAAGGDAGAAAAAGGIPGMALLEDPALLDVMPQLLEIIQPETLHEINRMLPHVTHILGGKERLLAMLDQTLGEGGPMKGVLDQLLGALLGGDGAAAGGNGTSSGGEGGAASAAEGDDEGAAGGIGSTGDGSGAFAATLREIIERVSDPDNDTAFTDTLASMGLDVSAAIAPGGYGGGGDGDDDDDAAASGAVGLAMTAEDIRAAFEGFKDQFGDIALGDIASLVAGGGGGEDEDGGGGMGGFSMERLAAMAAGALGGGEEGDGAAGITPEQTETVARLSAVISALQNSATAAGARQQQQQRNGDTGEIGIVPSKDMF